MTLVEGIEAASLHPAQVMGLSHLKGTLNFGSDADFLLLSDEGPLRVLNTFIGGECVFAAPEAPPLQYIQQKHHKGAVAL